jgi:hypothetical protein
MRPGQLNLDLYRGDSFSWAVYVWQDADKTAPVDLTGVTAKAQFRATPGGTDILAFTCAITLPNRIDVKLPASAWTGFTIRKGAWDLQLTWTTGGDVVTILAGTVNVVNDITDSEGAVAVAASANVTPRSYAGRAA